MSMNIAVLGVGAIGGIIGAYLERGGRSVTLIDQWPANVEHIRTDGLTITPHEEEFTVHPKVLHVGEVSAARQSFDVVVLSVKSYDTSWSSMLIEPYLAPGGYIVSAQNSINEEAIAAVVGWSRVVGCVVTIGAGMYEPGHVLRTSGVERPSFKVGEPSGMITPRLQELVEVLGDVGATRTTTNLWGERWSKLANNAMSNAVAGFAGLGTADLKTNPEARALSLRITAELLQVAKGLGVNVEPIYGIPAEMYLEAQEDGAKMEELEGRMMEAGKGLGDGRPSLAQDVIKGRKTEVDYLNGYVASKGKEVGVPTPVNEAVIEITKRVEAGELEPSLSNLKLIQI